MSIDPFVRCSDIKVSLTFYTALLDFNVVQAPDPDSNSFMSMYAYLEREGSCIYLSQHAGDGVFGSVIYVRVENINRVYKEYTDKGLVVQKVAGITMKPVDQTWGMREFYVADPDGNKIRFGQPMM